MRGASSPWITPSDVVELAAELERLGHGRPRVGEPPFAPVDVAQSLQRDDLPASVAECALLVERFVTAAPCEIELAGRLRDDADVGERAGCGLRVADRERRRPALVVVLARAVVLGPRERHVPEVHQQASDVLLHAHLARDRECVLVIVQRGAFVAFERGGDPEDVERLRDGVLLLARYAAA